MHEDILNAERPARIPVNPSGRTFSVIARFCYVDREEWRPAVTHRWTDTHALVEWWPDGEHGRTPDLIWLPIRDVTRVVVTTQAHGPQQSGGRVPVSGSSATRSRSERSE